MIKKIFTFLLLVLSLATRAQEVSGPQMADKFREDGKIWVVITVIALIFISLVAFLIILERKLSKLEKQINDKGLN